MGLSDAFALVRIAMVAATTLTSFAHLAHSEQDLWGGVCNMGKGLPRLYNCHEKFPGATDVPLNDSITLGPNATLHSVSDEEISFLVKLNEEKATAKTIDEICEEVSTAGKLQGTCDFKYLKVWLGFRVSITGTNMMNLLEKYQSVVEQIEIEGTVSIAQACPANAQCASQGPGNGPDWGLDRIDQQPGEAKLDGIYSTGSSRRGSGVHVYIIDTGIRCTHQDFKYADGRPGSRCLPGETFVKDGKGTNDCNGHGTHCAGSVAGLKYGVAKNAFVHPLRAMQCNGNGGYGEVMAALDWVLQKRIAPAVVSMSLATSASISIDQAVARLVNAAGVVAVAAAGNYFAQACNYSPAREQTAIAVGSTDSKDAMSYFSNFGACTDIFAPGSSILSCGFTSDTASQQMTGTSMACPAVAGAAALYLGDNPDARPTDVRQAIMDTSQAVVTNLKPATTNKLLNINFKAADMQVTPRSFYTAREGSTVTFNIHLPTPPTAIVTLTPALQFPSYGVFSPAVLTFDLSNWNVDQQVDLTFTFFSENYIDHNTLIYYRFTSADARFRKTFEGYASIKDTEVCSFPCGQTKENPKNIPKVPFYYIDDTGKYTNVYTAQNLDSAHHTGNDIVFRYTANADQVVDITLCSRPGTTSVTTFDSMLSVYSGTPDGKTINRLASNDDSCGVASSISRFSFIKGTTYFIMIDGYAGAKGVFGLSIGDPGAFFVTSSVEDSVVEPVDIPTAEDTAGKSFSTLWKDAPAKGSSGNFSIAGLMDDSHFFYNVSSWGECSATCGGGTQVRTLVCTAKNKTVVDKSNCANITDLPLLQRPCNSIACLSYALYKTAWSECNQTCGGGVQTREVHCVDSLGNTARPSACNVVGADDMVTSQPCNTQACGPYYWGVPEWSLCNMPCGGGTALRNNICYDKWGKQVGSNFCRTAGLPPPDNVKTCNTQPCQSYAWLMGDWSDCSGGCIGATRKRVVQCVDGQGFTADEAFCLEKGPKPLEVSYCQQTDIVCPFCSETNNCSGNGVCQNESCVCNKEWMGTYCEVPVICSPGRIAGDMGCCSSGIIDKNQNCCPGYSATTDRDGECCPSGKIDACGICNGPNMYVDSQTQCCTKARDEKGVCCDGTLDECRVCNGDSTSCATTVSLKLLVNNPASIIDTRSGLRYAFEQEFMITIGSLLGLDPSAIKVNSVGLEYQRGLTPHPDFQTEFSTANETASATVSTANGVASGVVVITFTILSIGSGGMDLIVRKEDIRSALLAARYGSGVLSDDDSRNSTSVYYFIPGVRMSDVNDITRIGICGNGVCEIGERCNSLGYSATTDLKSCCIQDCPYVSVACPAPTKGQRIGAQCSRNGRCLDASGKCDCFEGYMGDDCSICIPDWAPSADGTCSKMVNGTVISAVAQGLTMSQPQLSPPGSSHNAGTQGSSDKEGKNKSKCGAGCAVGVAFGCLGGLCVAVVVVVAVMRRRSAQNGRREDHRHLAGPPSFNANAATATIHPGSSELESPGESSRPSAAGSSEVISPRAKPMMLSSNDVSNQE